MSAKKNASRDFIAMARELITMRRAVDAGGGTVDLKASQDWKRQAYLYEELTLTKLLERIADLEARQAKVRKTALEEAAKAVEDHRRAGREWIPGSLWDTLSREAAARIRAIPSGDAA